MRTNIEIDNKLLRKAMALTVHPTKRALIEEALRLAVQLDNQARGLRQLWGIGWEGNLDEMRTSRFPDWDTREDKDNKSESSIRRKSVA